MNVTGRDPRLGSLGLAALCCWWISLSEPALANINRLTPAAAIETARFTGDGAVVAPDGTTYVVRLVRGDVQRNGVWLEVMIGDLNRAGRGEAPRSIARLFGTGLGDPVAIAGSDLVTNENPVRWIDDWRIAFIWPDRAGIRQVVEVDVHAGTIRYLTDSATHVYGFDVNSSGVVVYNAQRQYNNASAQTAVRNGLTVGPNVTGLGAVADLFGTESMLDVAWNSIWYVRRPGEEARPLTIANEDTDRAFPLLRKIAVSPNGRYAIVDVLPAAIPGEWSEYRGPAIEWAVRETRSSRLSQNGRRALQLFLVDLVSGTSRPLWNVPVNLGSGQIVWSPDSTSLLLAPTFLPPGAADPDGQTGSAVAVIEIASSAIETIPFDLPAGEPQTISWTGVNIIRFSNANGRNDISFVRGSGGWTRAVDETAQHRGLVRVRVSQSLTVPPTLTAMNSGTGRERVIFDPNPDIVRRLGRVERLSVGDPNSGWNGLLFLPPNYRRGTRYPLLIQLGTTDDGTFTLYGWQREGGLGPTQIAAYPGQVAAARGFAVLTLAPRGNPRRIVGGDPVAYTAAVDDAIRYLADRGLIETSRVGLVGFSRMGFMASYALTHSTFPFAAAVLADNYDASYMQTALTEWDRANDDIGAPPFGEGGVRTWLEHATGFRVERIQAPVLMLEQSLGARAVILANWEVFSRLRHLRQPVEMYLMPDINEHPSHTPQNPAQILAIQEKTLDWFDFWLNRREDANPSKAEQYRRWRELRDLRGGE